jgi:uncharacterized RDD family membrane protein YckC
MLDTVIAIETPEGIDFELVPSGPLARILAYASDFLIRTVLLLIIAVLLGTLGAFGTGIMLLCFFVLEWLYPVFFEVKKGATPGKYWLNLRVVQDDGTPVTFSSSLLRNLLRTADVLPLFYLTGLVSMLCNKEFKRLGDLAAGTLVIQLPDPPLTAAIVTDSPVPAQFHLSAEEQQAIVQFTLRATVLSEARQLELAKFLQPLLSCPEHELVPRLRQIGSHLLGVGALSAGDEVAS